MKINNYISIILFFSVIPFNAFSQNINQKDSLTILADSLHNDNAYKKALLVRKQALKEARDYPVDYLLYLKAKYYHTKSSDLEFKSYDYFNNKSNFSKTDREKYLDSALSYSFKARYTYTDISKPDKRFLYDIQNRIYHQTAYLGNWKHALQEAQLGYTYLKDTLSAADEKFVDLIYDIGYIYRELGDYTKAAEKFQESLTLYNNIDGVKQTSVADALLSISKIYNTLGFKRKELESLIKAEKIWEKDKENNYWQLYRCYRNLLNWYLYYGDVENAEKYMAKKKRLKNTKELQIFFNAEEKSENELNEWNDLTRISLAKKDTLKANEFLNKIILALSKNKKYTKFEIRALSNALFQQAIILKKSKANKAVQLLNKAIDIQKKYPLSFFTNDISFTIEKAKILIQQQKFTQAQNTLLTIPENIKNIDPIKAFQANVLLGQSYSLQKQKETAKKYFNKALADIDNRTDVHKITKYQDANSSISFETITSFLIIGDFYYAEFKERENTEYLKKAFYYYTISSQIFNQLYLGQRYNNTLYQTFENINQRLLTCASVEPKMVEPALNEIKNNSSKLTWSKFIFNNKRKLYILPEKELAYEEKLKTELNFYNTKLYNSNEESKEKKELWKNKIYELEIRFSKFKDSLKTTNQSYYKFNYEDFKLADIRNGLTSKSAIVKYMMVKDSLYAFHIYKDSLSLNLLGKKGQLSIALKSFLSKITNRELNYKNEQTFLKNTLFQNIPLKKLNKLIIIPDDHLFHLPFELLAFDKKMPLISYSTSLHLLKDQVRGTITNRIKLGAFTSAINSNQKKESDGSFDLNYANVEINNILELFDGTVFVNSSKNTFLRNVNKFNVLHLVMHSSLNQTNPEFSSLNFYGNPEQNKLFISEIYNESLNANLVVLSSCDTGSGVYENGEGVISISRAFTYAGVPSSVISLWKVPDKETSEIMLFFYEGLKKGFSLDKALHKAKLKYLNNQSDELLKHPYFWAGFVVSGNTSPIVTEEPKLALTNPLWISLGLFVLLGIGYFFFKSV